MIDLHLHTAASDGDLEPVEVVDRAASAGVTVMAVTDHDTTAALPEVRSAARGRGVDVVAGIEVTAVEDGRDVHVLGYFFDPESEALSSFLAGQRAVRVMRMRAIAETLAALGMPVDIEPVVDAARRRAGRTIGRPHVARALIDAGHVADLREAFDRWLGAGRPAFVPRQGASPEQVIEILHDAGGLASLAHPGRHAAPARIIALRDAGLDAIEVYHPDHDLQLVAHYARLAADLHCLVTGGSDFHGDGTHGGAPGVVSLPAEEWDRLLAYRRDV